MKFWKRPKTLKKDIFGSQNDHFWSFYKVLASFKISFSSLQHPIYNALHISQFPSIGANFLFYFNFNHEHPTISTLVTINYIIIIFDYITHLWIIDYFIYPHMTAIVYYVTKNDSASTSRWMTRYIIQF